MSACVFAYARARARACVCVGVRACVRVCACECLLHVLRCLRLSIARHVLLLQMRPCVLGKSVADVVVVCRIMK